jgi:succinate dehydrogenase/fumarate reductase flavoprotein subunit
MIQIDEPQNPDRRGFLGKAVAGTIAGGLAAGFLPARADAADGWQESFDVIVVGGGAAGCSAAVMAHELGDTVLLVETAAVLGGTAAKSVGGVWVPNNRFMRDAGVRDDREDCIKYMVRLAFPAAFDPNARHFGATEETYKLMGAFFDNASRVTDRLAEMGVINLISMKFFGKPVPDYFAHLPENKAPYGRGLSTADMDGKPADGAELMRCFAAAIAKRKIAVKKRCRAKQLVQADSGAIVGLIVEDGAGRAMRIRASKGVIFASGGFTHNEKLRKSFLKGPVFGGCAIPTNQGDFVYMGAGAGARLGNMDNAWWAQTPLEWALENPSVPTGIWCTPGDSMIQVNRKGQRFLDEKFVYNERTQAHFVWDAVSASYPNLLSFMIYDQRTADHHEGAPPIPAKGSTAAHVIKGADLDELSRKIRTRLDEIKGRTAGFELAPEFHDNLLESIRRFNGFAKSGSDGDFNRGNQPIDRLFHSIFVSASNKPESNLPNPTMYPISDKGPYYAIIIAPSTLDTKGGPVIDASAQVIDTQDKPIPGLYAAGNCNAGFAGQSYWGGGATLGVAITFGALAAESANKRVRAA